MSNKEILYKATRKAIKNGWDAPFPIREAFDSWWKKNQDKNRYFTLIYDPVFAKALFGTRIRCTSHGCIYVCDNYDQYFDHVKEKNCYSCVEMWGYILTQMVGQKNPLFYIQHFLEFNKDESEV